MYIINAVSLIRTFHLSEQNFEPMNQRGSDKRGCTVFGVCVCLCRAVGGTFEVIRPSGHVRLCLLVFVNVITVNILCW